MSCEGCCQSNEKRTYEGKTHTDSYISDVLGFEEVYGSEEYIVKEITMAGGGNHWWNYVIHEYKTSYKIYTRSKDGLKKIGHSDDYGLYFYHGDNTEYVTCVLKDSDKHNLIINDERFTEYLVGY